MTYEWHLVQLRLLADAQKDARSLVAIAAQFERDVIKNKPKLPIYIKRAVLARSHARVVNRRIES